MEDLFYGKNMKGKAKQNNRSAIHNLEIPLVKMQR